MTYRYVTGTILNTSSVPWVGTVYFTLVNRSYTTAATFPASTIAVILDNAGSFRTQLWCNEEGELSSYYIARLPDGSSFNFTLPVGTADIDISLLETGGVTPDDPQYETLLTYLEAYVNTQIGTVAKGEIALPFSFSSTNPILIATNFIGNVRIAGVIVQSAFNVASNLIIGDTSNASSLFNVAIDLTTPGTFEVYPGNNYTAPLNLTANLTTTATSGNGIIYLEI